MLTGDQDRDIRARLLRTPDANLLADYWLATDPSTDANGAAYEPLADMMPARVVREARAIRKRLEAIPGTPREAAVDRLVRPYSLHMRASAYVAPIVGAVLKAPWGVMIVVVTWLFVHMCHAPKVSVDYCTWYRAQELSNTDAGALREHISQLWISKFASDTMKTLPDACQAELNRGRPSIPCMRDTIATLDRIVLAESSELATIGDLDRDIQNWCPSQDVAAPDYAPAKARLLFEPDFISTWLWPGLYFDYSGKALNGIPSSPSSTDCDGRSTSSVTYGRNVARHHLRLYRELVQAVVRSGCETRGLLSLYAPDAPNPPEACRTLPGGSCEPGEACCKPSFSCSYLPEWPLPESAGYVAIVLHNVGDAPTEIDTKGATLKFSTKLCDLEGRVQLDPYDQRPTSPPDLLPDTVAIGPGQTVRLELKTSCSDMPDTNPATLSMKGLETAVEVSLAPQTTTGAGSVFLLGR